MPLNADAIRNLILPTVKTQLSARDAMFYAVSIGCGADPVDRTGLRFCYEQALRTFPTVAAVVGNPSGWSNQPRLGITGRMAVHGAMSIRNYGVLPVDKPLVSESSIVGLEDKGAKGAVIHLRRMIKDADSGDLLTIINTATFARADGGFGGDWGEIYKMKASPEVPAEQILSTPTRADAALLYRLNGDFNPLHADPASAKRAGFERPIHHGLGTFGITAWTLLRSLAPEGDLELFEARFSRPFYPGETLLVDVWRTGRAIAFRARAAERGVTVLDSGRAVLKGGNLHDG